MACNCNCVTEEEILVSDQDGILLQDLEGATRDDISDNWQLYIEEPIVGTCNYRGRKITRSELLAGGGSGEVVPWRGYVYMDADMDNGCWLVANGRTITYQNQTTGDTELVTMADARGRVLVTPNQGDELGTGITGNDIKKGFAKSRLQINQMPNHNHGVNDPGHRHNYIKNNVAYGAGTVAHDDSDLHNSDQHRQTEYATTGISILLQGGGNAHNNMQPSLGKTLFFNSCREGWDIVNISGVPVLVPLNDSNWDEDNLNDPNA